MENIIQKHRVFVAGQIEKSFNNEFQVPNQEVERAYNVGDERDFNGRTYYVHGIGKTGAPLWRLKEKKVGQKPSPRKPGSTGEIEKMDATKVRQSILGLNNIGTNVKDKGDYFHIEFDANDFNTHGQRSPQIDRIAKFLEGMGASCVFGKNSIKAYKKVESKKTDPRDKIAQDAGFKDYSEMKGWQEYVTAKSLLKKPSMQASTKKADREALEKQVADYEKEHKNVIDVHSKNKTKSTGREIYYKTLAERFCKTGECKSTDALIAVYKERDPRKNIEAARALRKYIMKDLNYRDNDDWTKTLNEYKKQRLNADKAGDRDAYKAYNCAYQAVKDRIAKDAKNKDNA